MSRCEVCGEWMRGIGRKRRFGLWLRARLERLAFLVDKWTAPRYRVEARSHLHLTDEEWAAFEDGRAHGNL